MPQTTAARCRTGPVAAAAEMTVSWRTNGATPTTPGTAPILSMSPPRSVKPSGSLVRTVTMGMLSTKVCWSSSWNPFMIARVRFSTATPRVIPVRAITAARFRNPDRRRLRR